MRSQSRTWASPDGQPPPSLHLARSRHNAAAKPAQDHDLSHIFYTHADGARKMMQKSKFITWSFSLGTSTPGVRRTQEQQTTASMTVCIGNIPSQTCRSHIFQAVSTSPGTCTSTHLPQGMRCRNQYSCNSSSHRLQQSSGQAAARDIAAHQNHRICVDWSMMRNATVRM